MTLQKKVLITIGAAIVFMVVVLFAISQIFILSSFIELEEEHTRQNVEQVTNALAGEISHIDTITFDWAAWDDTYAFIEDRNEEYIASNLIDGTFADLELNLMLFIDSSGQIVFGKAFDLENEEELPIPPSLVEHLAPNAPLVHHTSTEGSTSGIVLLADDPMLVASRPIITSLDGGPIRGALIMGRYLDSGEIEDLGETTQVSLSAHRFDDSQLPSDFKAAESFLSEDAHIFIQPLSEESIAGYALLEDIYGQPALVLKVDMPRSIYGQGQATVNYFILLILAIGLMFSVAVLLFLNKFVLAPLSRLSDGVSSIGASSDLSHRVPISGRDEFSKLGGTINETLASLEQSQRALQESEEKYSTFFKTSRDPVFITSRDGRWLDFNEAMVEILGYENRDELMKVNVPDLYANPDERGQHIKTIEEQGFSKEYPVNLRRKDGGIINTLITSVVKKDEAGNVMGFQGTIRDVTERKRWEEERARAEKRQLHLIKELERVNEELKDFAYIISHDLKAPLRAITSLAQWISEDYADKLDNEGKELLDLLMSRVKRMHALIDGVLEYSRIGRLEEEKSEVDLNTLVSGVIDLIQPPETIDIDIVDQLPTIYCEKTRMEQVFQNLLSNAVRYMDEPEGKVRIGCTEEDGYWKFSVADNGPGIEEKYYKDIFQMFQTLKPRDEVESTGVGLTIAKKIVESQGGEIWVESKVGEGSTFFFTVPKEAGGDNHEKGRLDTPGRR